jgi:hypothetical protein
MAEKPPVKDPEIEACLARIEEARGHLSRTLAEMKAGGIFNPLDWRRWFRQHPVGSTVGAAAAGFLLAEATDSSRQDGKGLLDDLVRTGIETLLRNILSSSF